MPYIESSHDAVMVTAGVKASASQARSDARRRSTRWWTLSPLGVRHVDAAAHAAKID
jgi:hypothetical protein